MSNTQRIMSKPKALNREKLRAFALPIRQNRCATILGKPNKTKAKVSPWLSRMRKPLKLRSAAHLRMAAKMSAAIFVEASGERFRKNPEGLKRAAGQTASVSSAGAGVKGNTIPFGGVKRRQSLIGVPG